MAANDNAELIIKACALHGSIGEPDHEVGDLQDALRVAFHNMTPIQQAKVLKEVEEDEGMVDFIAAARDEDG